MRSRRSRLLLSWMLTIIAGCTVQLGASTNRGPVFPGAAAGAQVALRMPAGRRHAYLEYRGELIAFQEDGVVIAIPRETTTVLTFTPWSEVRRLNVINNLRYRLSAGPGRQPDPEAVAAFSPLSRFPQGLSEEMLARLLANYNQQALEPLQGQGPD